MNSQAYEMMQAFPPEMPPPVPVRPFEAAVSPAVTVPVVYEREKARPVEYQVLTLSAPTAAELETTLNTAGRQGWWLIQIVSERTPLMLVMMRQSFR